MAKSTLSFKRSTTDKLTIKGVLTENGAAITYTDEDDEERTIPVASLLNAFRGQAIAMNVSLKTDEDLDLSAE